MNITFDGDKCIVEMERDAVSTFAARLKFVRMMSGMPQKQLAAAAGIRPPTLCAYEMGQANPSLEVGAKLAKELNVSLDFLCGLKNEVR